MPSLHRPARAIASCAPHEDSSAWENTAVILGLAVSQSSISRTAGSRIHSPSPFTRTLMPGCFARTFDIPLSRSTAGDEPLRPVITTILPTPPRSLVIRSATCSAIVTLLCPMNSVLSDGTSRSSTTKGSFCAMTARAAGTSPADSTGLITTPSTPRASRSRMSLFCLATSTLPSSTMILTLECRQASACNASSIATRHG